MQLTHGGIGWTLLKGKHTPLDLYARLYQSRCKPIVLDDLDGLMRDPNNTAMLKCVCDTTPVKRVEWGSFHHAFRSTDNLLPKAFDSISRVCAVANDVGTLRSKTEASCFYFALMRWRFIVKWPAADGSKTKKCLTSLARISFSFRDLVFVST